jgi:ethanolamine ammonia-lyase large subunit
MGVPMGVDICYTNHAEADEDDLDTLLITLGAAGCSFVITVPGGDDIMLSYQTLSYQDALVARQVLGLRPAPEFEDWLAGVGLFDRETLRVPRLDAGDATLRRLTGVGTRAALGAAGGAS